MKFSLEEAVNKTKKYITANFTESVESTIKNKEKTNTFLKTKIEQYIKEENIEVNDIKLTDLIDIVYAELNGFSILEPLLNRTDIEEININSYKDISVKYDNGDTIYLKNNSFFSSEHLKDILGRVLQHSNMILDTSTPVVTGHLRSNVRITVASEPIVDKNIGAIASIRMINPKDLKENDFINNGTASKEILTFLQYAYKNGISTCVGGATGSGKTTLMSYLLTGVEDDKRLITIEENTREYNLIKRDSEGYMTNNVIHFVTRESKEEEQNISQKKLIKTSMTLDPDYICINEMKGEESLMAVSSAYTGHPVLTTLHTKSCRDAYMRMLLLCKEMFNIDDKILLQMIVSAFPLVVYIKKYNDNVRRIQEITECIGLDDNNKPIINTLYEFKVEKNYIDKKTNKRKIEGEFIKSGKPSDFIKKCFLENDKPEDDTFNKIFN